MISPLTSASGCPRYLGCHSFVCWGQQGRGRNACVWGLFRFPPWLALEGLCLLPVGPEHRPHPWGAAACTLHRPHFAQTKCLGRGRTGHTRENVNFQGTVEPRTHHRLQKDPATLAKQVAPLQCFSRGQRAARVWRTRSVSGPQVYLQAPGAGKWIQASSTSLIKWRPQPKVIKDLGRKVALAPVPASHLDGVLSNDTPPTSPGNEALGPQSFPRRGLQQSTTQQRATWPGVRGSSGGLACSRHTEDRAKMKSPCFALRLPGW